MGVTGPGIARFLVVVLIGSTVVGCGAAFRTEPPVVAARELGTEAEPAAEPAEPAPHVAAAPEPEPVLDEPGSGGLTPSPLDELAAVPPVPPDPPPPSVVPAASEPAEPSYDVPVVMNEAVLAWIDRYSTLHRDSTRRVLARSGRYLPMFRRIFAEAGLPQDLAYMAQVESGYRTSAYSRARARGIFQFMTGTARHYGLRVDYWVDDRADPEKSAHAAAAYMKKLYREFGDWYLAIAAYNAGEGTVRRAIARTGSRDFWRLARTRHLRRETKNHVPAVLAAMVLAKNPAKYGLETELEPPIAYDTIVVDGAADLRLLAECAGAGVDELARLNPGLRRGQTPPESSYELRVPPGRGGATLAALARVPANERVLYARHRVERGESLSVIARRHGVGVRDLQAANGLGRSTMIRAGQVLQVPTASASRFAGVAPPVAEAPSTLRYRVRRGDTLSALARRHDTTVAAIAAASGISPSSRLQIGQRLTIRPGTRSVASSSPPSPSSGVHVVRRGDTLWGIASAYRTTVDALCALNGMRPDQILRPGLRLRVAR